MVKNDDMSFPEFRAGFFKLVQNIIKHCAAGLFSLEGSRFETIVLTVIFAMQHEKPELMELGLVSMQALNHILSENPHNASIFYQNFYSRILKETMVVITDYRHMSGFKYQGLILQQLLQAVDRNDVIQGNIILNDPNGQPHQFGSNKQFVQEYLVALLLEQFPNLNKVQVEGFILKLFNSVYEWTQFKGNLRDLLISMKSFAHTDDAFY